MTSLQRFLPERSLATALGLATLLVYTVLVAGIVVLLRGAPVACAIGCGPWWLLHTLGAAAVGLGVLVLAAVAHRSAATRRVRGAVLAAGVLVLLHVVTPLLGIVLPWSAQLASGGLAFIALLAGFLWHLEAGPDPEVELTGHRARPAPDDPEPAHHLREATLTERLRAYLALTKPNLMWLLLLVAYGGLGLAAGASAPLTTWLWVTVGGVLAVGASGVFNHLYERATDARMARTNARPLVQGLVEPRKALAFGAVLTVGAVGAFWQLNPLSALLGLAAIVFYSVVYTILLKPNTVQNIVLGGAAGSFPALIGWAAATGGLAWPAWVLAAVIFLWTPAHFYNLALAFEDDYRRGGFPMLPVVRGRAVTRRHIVLYGGATMLAAAVLAAASPLGWAYAASAVLGAAILLAGLVKLLRDRTDKAAFQAFGAANLYLAILLAGILVDTLLV